MLSPSGIRRAMCAATVVTWAIGGLTIPVLAQDTCTIDVNQPSIATCLATLNRADLAQSFRPTVNICNGAGIFFTTHEGETGEVRIQLWDGLPNAGGSLLAAGGGDAPPGKWFEVSWPDVAVVPGDEYFLVFEEIKPKALGLCIGGDTTNPYPDGIAYAGFPFTPLPKSDYSFRTCGYQRGADCDPTTSRIDFGVTPDDNGDPHACVDFIGEIITNQYLLTQSIRFGTAVDNFQPADVVIANQTSCDPTCRSTTIPPEDSWWCQFWLSTGPNDPGVPAGVTSFSAEVCLITEVDVPLMFGWNNDRQIIATASSSQLDTEVLTLVAPPGELIAYVQVGGAGGGGDLTVDCLQYPDPEPRVGLCDPSVRIDFGVTPDDNGDSHACVGFIGQIITNQYLLTQGIRFGTAIDNFQPVDVVIANQISCDPTCRSARWSLLAGDFWWCQFWLSTGPDDPGVPAGVTSFSAEVCLITEVGAPLMFGWNNDRQIIAFASSSQLDTEVLTIVAPPGTLIAYVSVRGVGGTDARAVDCLQYPDPVPRDTRCDPSVRIDFGVTPDDNGNDNACTTDGATIITTEYVHTQNIVFGTAVDNFGPPAVSIRDDIACDPTCRSGGSPSFTDPWWCQFKLSEGPGEPGAKAGVTSFSADVCYIDEDPGTTLMWGYNNDRELIATAENTQIGAEVLSIVAPEGQLIAYVQIGNTARPAGLSVDCLSYPDPIARTLDCPWSCGDNDNNVGIVDLLALLAQWGTSGACDFNGDGTVDIVDLLKMLSNWGPCDACTEPLVCGVNNPTCTPDGLCVCIATYDGATVCVDGQISCAGLVACPDGNCPPGTTCLVDTCCEENVCVPDMFFCVVNAAATQRPFVPGQRTLGSEPSQISR